MTNYLCHFCQTALPTYPPTECQTCYPRITYCFGSMDRKGELVWYRFTIGEYLWYFFENPLEHYDKNVISSIWRFGMGSGKSDSSGHIISFNFHPENVTPKNVEEKLNKILTFL
jgi:hypothetical protein